MVIQIIASGLGAFKVKVDHEASREYTAGDKIVFASDCNIPPGLYGLSPSFKRVGGGSLPDVIISKTGSVAEGKHEYEGKLR